jgi:hypothetical protein
LIDEKEKKSFQINKNKGKKQTKKHQQKPKKQQLKKKQSTTPPPARRIIKKTAHKIFSNVGMSDTFH